MKKLLIVLALAWLGLQASAQATNPQNSFSAAVNINNPSLWLNFNDATTTVRDSVSGLNFAASSVSYGGTPDNYNGGGNGGGSVVVVSPAFSVSGTLQSIYFKAQAIPNTTQTFLIMSGTGPSFTIVSSFTATVAATTEPQILIAGVNFTAQAVTAGQSFGNWVATGISAGYDAGASTSSWRLLGQSTLPSGAQTYSSLANVNFTFAGGVAGASLATAHQPGFDNTNNANYAAKFPYNSFNMAQSTSMGSVMNWNTAWTMMLQINKLNWDHSGRVVLASKGDSGTGINNVFWQFYLQVNAGNALASQLCFARSSPAPSTAISGGPFLTNQTWCTQTAADALPSGFNYNLVVEDNGSGGTGSISIWINGLAQAITQYNMSSQGFGGITAAVTSGGTGYTSAPTLAVVGGGSYCSLNPGTSASVSGGAVTAVAIYSSGCTSTPTITVTGGGGTGAVVTATSYAMTMNSSTYPLMVPGYVNGGMFYGPGGSDTAENPLYVDEFAIFAGDLNFKEITNIFYETKFYQGLVYPSLTSNPPLVILNGYGCGPDFSGDQTTAMVIGAHKAGLIRLIGFDVDDGGSNGYNSVGWWRQMLDQAGLADVPIGIGANSPTANLGGCPAANITAYNANTPQNGSAYESAATLYRTLFAKYPTTPIYVMMTQTANGYNSFQLSPADSISSLTGLQLQAQNYANGGWVNAFEGNFATTPASYLSVLNNFGNLPIYFEGGTPALGGPGILASRTANDPLYLAAAAMSGGDVVSGWTNQNVAQLLTPYFLGGVQIAVSGGTGYAGTTALTSMGGGPNCNVTGFMASSGGVPTGSFYSPWYSYIGTTYDAVGYGCTPAVFTATGSGTNLTVSAITCCQIGPVSTAPAITIGDTISGAGIPTGTRIVSQTSGPTGGVGVYVTSIATTASAATITRTPTIVLTAPTGTGAVLTVSNSIFIKSYEGSATASYAVWPIHQDETTWPVFTWFQNSLMDPPTTGAPRPY